MPILDAFKKFLSSYRSFRARSTPPDVSAFLDEVFHYFPFTAQTQEWLRRRVRVEVFDWRSLSGGGGFYPDQWRVHLSTIQYEAAIHELAHALWHKMRGDRQTRDALVAAVQQLAEDADPRWERLHGIARDYICGIPTQPDFVHGMRLPPEHCGSGGGINGEWNDCEMFAGLASGCMADIRLMPPYLRRFYTDMFVELPPDAPSPAQQAPHR